MSLTPPTLKRERERERGRGSVVICADDSISPPRPPPPKNSETLDNNNNIDGSRPGVVDRGDGSAGEEDVFSVVALRDAEESNTDQEEEDEEPAGAAGGEGGRGRGDHDEDEEEVDSEEEEEEDLVVEGEVEEEDEEEGVSGGVSVSVSVSEAVEEFHRRLAEEEEEEEEEEELRRQEEAERVQEERQQPQVAPQVAARMVAVMDDAVMDDPDQSTSREHGKAPPPQPSSASGPMWDFVEELFSSEQSRCAGAVARIKFSLIGSNKQKSALVERGLVPRLINLLGSDESPAELRTDAAYALGSVAKGADGQIRALIDSGIVPVLLTRLFDPDARVVEACLCCLKTVFQHPDAPIDLVYSDAKLVPHLVSLTSLPACRVSVAHVLTHACKTREHQDVLSRHGLVPALRPLVSDRCPSVHLPALHCLAFLCIGNEDVSATVYSCDGLLRRVVALMDRGNPAETQLAAARVVTYLYRCRLMDDTDEVILYRTLPCVVRMSKMRLGNSGSNNVNDVSPDHKVLAIETLAYLIEVSADLQRVAAITDHLIHNMAACLVLDEEDQLAFSGNNNVVVASRRSASSFAHGMSATRKAEMRRAAFRVFASLGANDEEIRKKVIETPALMPTLVSALEDETRPRLQMAAVGCLHSLSRSVQLLRTTFQDHPVWRPLMRMLSAPPSPHTPTGVETLIVASSTLCNLLLEFSPSKEPILDSGAIEMLCELTQKYEPSLRLNGVWGLMNIAFQAEQRIKVQIINALGADHIFRLLSDRDTQVVMKTLGLLRNLLSTKPHIDHIMAHHGTQVMQAVVLILESDNRPDVKEQALCIVANIADGDSAKQFIMSNDDVLKKVINYMLHTNSKLQQAAVVCVQNLTWSEDDGAGDRQQRLRDMGVHKILHQLVGTADAALAEKVKGAISQFG